MKFLTLIFLFCLHADASDLVLRFGIEPVKKSGSYSDVKQLSLGYEASISDNTFWKIDVGYWTDNRTNASDAAYLAPALGLVIRPWIFKMKVFAGFAAISDTDNYLGGHFQFYEGLYLGLFEGKASIGFDLFHLSSAGLYAVNKGRNFFTLSAVYSL